MTFTLRLPKISASTQRMLSATTLLPSDVSVVVPVKDNQVGASRLVAAFSVLNEAEQPGELILVDNMSELPLAKPEAQQSVFSVLVVRCSTPGPAAARNTGARLATGSWLLFMDSDCIPKGSTITGYQTAMNAAVAFAGTIHAVGRDLLSQYYDSQKILVPPPNGDRPAYLVTANTLVWRAAFNAVGGFDERFPLPGGEDIDFALRLRAVGDLSYAPDSVVLHDFNDGVAGFVRRFIRYGRGNLVVQAIHGSNMAPQVFWPERPTPFNVVAALMQICSMAWGYWTWRAKMSMFV